jgi:TetR/AcrR family transcriptional regulator, regulator of cefoperazone and chloramphenicol sensitivity
MALLDDTKTRLLQAAGKVFAAKGFEAATVREICRLAEVSNIAAVNYYFRDKESLYLESVRQAYCCRLSLIPRPDWPAGTPPADKLRYFIRSFLEALLEASHQPWQLELMMRELAHPSAACVEFVRDLARPNFDLVLGILDEVVPAATPPTKRHLIALSIIGQCIYHRLARAVVATLVGEEEFQIYDAARLADHIIDFSLGALGLQHVPPRSTDMSSPPPEPS